MSDAKRKRNFGIQGLWLSDQSGTIILVALSNIFRAAGLIPRAILLETIGVVAFGISGSSRAGSSASWPIPCRKLPGVAESRRIHEVLRVEVVEHADPQIHAEREAD